MIPTEVLITFVVASGLLALVPGPDNLYVLSQSVLHGRAAGIRLTLGFCSGVLVHTSAVTLGIAAAVQASPFAYTGLKIFGGSYLAYLAWLAFRDAGPKPGANQDSRPAPALNPWQLFLRGFIMNVSNPKVLLFFLAFLPQFINPQTGPVAPQIMLLGIAFLLVTLVVFGTLAILAGSIGKTIRHHQHTLQRMAGVVFLLFAVKLLFSTT